MSNETTVTGGRELADLLSTLAPKIEKNIMRAALRAGGVVLRREARERVPKGNGDLWRSIRITGRATREGVQVSVKAGNAIAYYAHMVEFGTRPHYIKVDDRDRGRGRKAGTLASIGAVNKRVLQIGANFIGPSVYHGGARPRPFLRPAAEAGFVPAVEAIQAKIRERLTEQGLNSPASIPLDPAE